MRQHPNAAPLRKRLRSAFAALRHDGYFARMNFWCCQSCAWSAIPDEQAEKAVFYHQQSNDDITRTGEVYLYWAGDAKHIVERLNEQPGLIVQWNGEEGNAIHVSFKEEVA